jgi:general secretion pathway protein G
MDTTKQAQRGFTLLEVMIVTAVIAILALVLVPNFSNARDQAATATCESNLQEIATAAELYYADVQAYPANGAVTAADFTSQTSQVAYLGTTPLDPAAQTTTATYTFTYTPAGSGQPASYTILCPGTHPSSTLAKLLNATASTTLIEYASGVGLEAGN